MLTRSRSRLLTLSAVLPTVVIGSWTGMATAAAHIHVASDNAVRGDDALVTFQVPNESEKGSPTTKVTITLPDVAAASTDVLAGWTATLDRTADGAFRAVTFTATPNAGIGAQQFELFSISIALPDTESVTFPVVQTYADGTTVHWDQPLPANGAEPEFPAPTLKLTVGPHAPPTPPDNTARALAGGALLVGAIGVGVALTRRRA